MTGLLVVASVLTFAGQRAAVAAPQPGPLARTAALQAPTPPRGSTDEGAASATTPVSVQVVLAPTDPAGLNALVASLYNPAAPNYHHWLTPQQFAARFAPDPATVAETEAWLGARGLRATRTSTFAITAGAPVSGVDQALGTSYHTYRTAAGATGLVAQGSPLVPTDLAGRVAALNGLSTLPVATASSRPVQPLSPTTHRPTAATPEPSSTGSSSTGSSSAGSSSAGSSSAGSSSAVHAAGRAATPLLRAAAAPAACPAAQSTASLYGGYTMDQLSSDYGVDGLLGAGLNGSGQKVGVYELGQSVASDVSAYETCFGLSNPFSVVNVDGGALPDVNGSAEANLDIEQIATQAPGASIVSYEAPNTNTGAYDLWNQIITADAVKVVSTSWAYCEPDAYSAGELSGSLGTLFAEAAADGQTILAASGDSGSESCAQDYSTGPWSSLAVTYPSSDPNVTSVGGTDYLGAGNEPVWNDCGGTNSTTAFNCASNYNFQAAGGGGESTYETRPAWQPDVFDWPAGTNAACGTSCREVPDLSANAGVAMVDYAGGQWGAGVGTSYAAPLMAGLVADRNQGCTAPTGNISPYLYSLAVSPATYSAAFNDVTQGNNDMLADHTGSFAAAPGYDLASGLGTPHAAALTCPEVTSVAPQGGAAGSRVTISGLGLEDATIYFGSTPVTPVSSTATSATVVLPTGSDYVTVSAADTYGHGTLTTTYGYQGAPTTTTTSTSTTTIAPTTTTTVPAPTTTTAVTCPSAPGRPLGGGAGIASVEIGGCDGYFVVDSSGRVAAFGAATWQGDLAAYRLAAPIIAIEATPDGQGYWLLGADGGVFTFGDARFFGSTGGVALTAPVVGMAVTPDNLGYWIVARDGGVFSFGDAHFYGSTGGIRLQAPVDGIAVAPGGHGYWLVASDGGVFTFTSDGFYGSLGGVRLAEPVVGMSSTPDGRGYTLVGSDGGVFSFGDAPFYGSLGSHPPTTPVVDLSPAPANDGYYLVTAGGSVYDFGPGTRFFGNA